MSDWVKSRYSNAQGNCLELARLPGGGVALRDSRAPDGPVLVCSVVGIRLLVATVKGGHYDRPPS